MANFGTAKGSRKPARRKVHGKSILYFLKTAFRNNRPLVYSISLLTGRALFVSAANFDISIYNPCKNPKPTIKNPNYVSFPSFYTSLSMTYCIKSRRFSAASASKLYEFQRTTTERLANLCFNIADIQKLHEKSIQAALSHSLDVATMESDMQSGVQYEDDLQKYNLGVVLGQVIPKYLEELLVVRNEALTSLGNGLYRTRQEIEISDHKLGGNALNYPVVGH